MAFCKRLCITAFCLLAVLGAAYAAGGDKEPSVDNVPDCCRELLARIERLEARVRQLETGSPILTIPAPPPGQPPVYRFDQSPWAPPGIDPRRLPPGTQEREFNGMKYYILPLDKARGQG